MNLIGRLTVAGTLALVPLSALHAQTPDLATAISRLEYREIGPALMGGRIADLAVVESKPQTFYIGAASGGVWKTENHGTSWTPLFDDQPTSSIGDVTIHQPNPNLIWVGTGEPQNRQSSPWGNGVAVAVTVQAFSPSRSTSTRTRQAPIGPKAPLQSPFRCK